MQAVEVRALGLKPADKNDAWSVKANQLIHSKIYNKVSFFCYYLYENLIFLV